MFAADYLLNLEIRLCQLSKREDTKFAYDLLFFFNKLTGTATNYFCIILVKSQQQNFFKFFSCFI